MEKAKFRGWNDKSKSWVYITIGEIMTIEHRGVYEEMCIDGVEWCQFIGKYDKDNTEIYEGDDVGCEFNDLVMNIEFHQGVFGYWPDDKRAFFSLKGHNMGILKVIDGAAIAKAKGETTKS